MHSFIYPFMHSFIHPFIHSSIHSFIHSSIHAFIHSSIHSFIHSSIHAYIHSFIHSSIHPSIHACIHPTHPPTHLPLLGQDSHRQHLHGHRQDQDFRLSGPGGQHAEGRRGTSHPPTHPPTHPPRSFIYSFIHSFIHPPNPSLTVANSNRLVLLYLPSTQRLALSYLSHPPTHPPTHSLRSKKPRRRRCGSSARKSSTMGSTASSTVR